MAMASASHLLLVAALTTVFALLVEGGVVNPPALADNKINDGAFVNISRFPWQVAIIYNSNHFCGGSIISKDWIITAAHCTYGKIKSLITLRVGSSSWCSGGQLYSVDKEVSHPNFVEAYFINDITLLKTTVPISFVGPVSAVKLPTDEPLLPSTKLTVTGWGRIDDDDRHSSTLKMAELFLIDFEVCRTNFPRFAVESGMICNGRKDGMVCMGDSGGPVTMGDVLVGIVSYGFRTCGEGPFVSTKVSKHRDWIKKSSGV